MRSKFTPIDPLSFSEKQIARFWSKIDQSGGPDACWPFLRGKRSGYGRVKINGRLFNAHRIAFVLSTGIDPGDNLLLHSCDNPPCCNPAHHIIGTYQDNVDDMFSKGRGRKATGMNHWRVKNPELSYGERNNFAKLTEADVIAIRQRYADGNVTLKSLGTEYGVTEQNIWLIVHRKHWRHVA